MLGAVLGQAGAGSRPCRSGWNTLPGAVRRGVTCFDRNFPGDDLITAILQAGGHVIARVKEGISLPFDGPLRLAARRIPHDLAERAIGQEAGPVPVRAAEHNVTLPSGTGSKSPPRTGP